jgi:hypothetical protein
VVGGVRLVLGYHDFERRFFSSVLGFIFGVGKSVTVIPGIRADESGLVCRVAIRGALKSSCGGRNVPQPLKRHPR